MNKKDMERRVGSYQQVDPLTLRSVGDMPKEQALPKGFFLGVADADYQVVGRAPDAVPTIWDAFVASRDLTPPGDGVGRFAKWTEDIKLMKELGVTDYRTSISMARTLKENGEVNQEAMKWYKDYFQALNDADIKVYATLYHWELPEHVAQKDPENYGWKNRETIDWTVKHAKAVAENLDENIEEYFMFNEPWCSTILSHYYGGHPPGEQNLSSALLAAHNILVAHGAVYNGIKEVRPDAKIGTVLNMETKYPASNDPKDIQAALYADGVSNTWFSDPLFKGEYPADLVELFGKQMPQIQSGDMELMKVGPRLDSLGINYYASGIINWSPDDRLHIGRVLTEGEPQADIIWQRPVYPRGLYDILTQVNEDYHPKKLYVTENGMADNTPLDPWTGTVPDTRRAVYIKEHVRQALLAKEAGVPVEGHFVWTLVDNFEWAEGYSQKFGIVDVDRDTHHRTPKQSAIFVRETNKSRKINP